MQVISSKGIEIMWNPTYETGSSSRDPEVITKKFCSECQSFTDWQKISSTKSTKAPALFQCLKCGTGKFEGERDSSSRPPGW